jgi:hypothetical protein
MPDQCPSQLYGGRTLAGEGLSLALGVQVMARVRFWVIVPAVLLAVMVIG